MIDKQMLEILVCPQDHTPLQVADPQLLSRLNGAIDAGGIENLAGQGVQKRLEAALVRQAKDLLYPIVDGIPVLLADEAIDLQQIP